MKKKYYELEAGDKANHGEILTFVKVDGMYAQWTNEKGEIVIGHSYEYEEREGIYYPVTTSHDTNGH